MFKAQLNRIFQIQKKKSIEKVDFVLTFAQ